jgi:hypothetical protein
MTSGLKRLGWFVALYAGSVLAVGALSLVLKAALKP